MLRLQPLICLTLLVFAACGGQDLGDRDGPPPPPAALEVETTALPDGEVAQTYGATLSAEGGDGAAKWSIVGAGLPEGLRLTNARIEGTPTAAGDSTFTVEATDTTGTARAQLTIHIEPAAVEAPPNVRTSSLPSGERGEPYTARIEGAGGTEQGYAWSIVEGAPPTGLTLGASGTPSTMLTGTPEVAGSFTFTVSVTDDAGLSGDRELQVFVAEADVIVRPDSLRALYAGTATTVVIRASGATGEGFSWTLSDGALPSGLTFNPADDFVELTGTPDTIGRFDFTVEVQHDASGRFTRQSYTLDVYAPLELNVDALPAVAMVGSAYVANFSSVGGAPGNRVWSVAAGALPPGLTLSPQVDAARIDGTPTQDGVYTFTIEVADANGVSVAVAGTIDVGIPLQIDTVSLPSAVVATPYAATLSASGGTGAGYIFSISSGAPPPGIALGASGTFAGTSSSAAGSYAFGVRVEDSAGTFVTRPLSIEVVEPIEITTRQLMGRDRCAPGIETIATVGGTPNATRQWNVTAGALPSGWVVQDGQVYGRATTAGTYTFTIEVSDPSGLSDAQTYNVTIAPSLHAPMPAYLRGEMLDATRSELFEVDLCGTAAGPLSRISPVSTTAEVAGAYLSPDGTHLAYVGDYTVAARNDLYVVRLTAPRTTIGVLPNPSASLATIHTWMADSSTFVYSRFGTSLELFAIDVPNLTPVTVPSLISTPVPSGTGIERVRSAPDGHGVVYGTVDANFTRNAWYVNFEGFATAPSIHTFGLGVFSVSTNSPWAPDASVAAYAFGGAIYAMNTLTSPPASNLVVNSARLLGIDFADTLPARGVFVADNGSGSDAAFLVTFTNGVPGTPVAMLPTLTGARDARIARFNPQGTQIAFCGDLDRSGDDDLYIADVSGPLPTMPIRISAPVALREVACSIREESSFTWSPDGSRLAYAAPETTTGGVQAWVADIAGGAPFVKVAATPPSPTVDINGLHMIWSADSQRLVTVADFVTRVSSVVVTHLDSTAPPVPMPVWPTPTTGEIFDAHVALLADGGGIVFLGNVRDLAVREAFVVDFLDGALTPPTRIHATLPSGGMVRAVEHR